MTQELLTPGSGSLSILNHRVTCGNVMDGIDRLMQNEKADIFYSDPPWGQGNLSYWQTMNHKMNGISKVNIDLSDFLNQIFALAKKHTSHNGAIFIEYGMKWLADVIKIGEAHGLKHIGHAQIKYRGGDKWYPHHLHLFSLSPKQMPPGYFESLHDMTGIPCLEQAMAPFMQPGAIILDPCCGLGMTARFAKKHNLSFRGNELNPKRLKVTTDMLQR